MKESGKPGIADLLRWAETLSGIARTGLAFTENLYERERFEEVLRVASDIRAAAAGDARPESVFEEWRSSVGAGTEGYVTAKIAVGAIVGNDRGEVLLTRRADSGAWLYPVGWADVGYSPSEVAAKEVYEETGIEAQPLSLIAVLDTFRLGLTRMPVYTLLFHCRVVGGELRPHPLEVTEVGFFPRESLPEPLLGAGRWVARAFDAIDGTDLACHFDPPLLPPWRNLLAMRSPGAAPEDEDPHGGGS